MRLGVDRRLRPDLPAHSRSAACCFSGAPWPAGSAPRLARLDGTRPRPRELDAAHRRDGAALGIIALGLVSSIAVWFHAAGPVGVGLTELLRLFVGNGALALPVALFLLGIHMLRQVPIPGQRGRLLVGTVTLECCGSRPAPPVV